MAKGQAFQGGVLLGIRFVLREIRDLLKQRLDAIDESLHDLQRTKADSSGLISITGTVNGVPSQILGRYKV